MPGTGKPSIETIATNGKERTMVWTNPTGFLETTVQAMAARETQGQRCWDPQIRDQEVTKAEIKEEKPMATREEEVSASLSRKEPKKENN